MVRGKQKEPHLQEISVCCSFRPMENTSTGPGGWFSSCSAAGSSSPLVKITISSAVRATTMVSSARASSAGAPLCSGVYSGVCLGITRPQLKKRCMHDYQPDLLLESLLVLRLVKMALPSGKQYCDG